jgi:hypothetical protein
VDPRAGLGDMELVQNIKCNVSRANDDRLKTCQVLSVTWGQGYEYTYFENMLIYKRGITESVKRFFYD